MSVSMPFQQPAHVQRAASRRTPTEALQITVQDPHALNRKPIILQVPLDEVALKHAKEKAEIEKPKKAHVNLNSPFSRRETYLRPAEEDMLHINQRPTPAQDLERAQKVKKQNRIIRNVGILGLTGIGALAVTFAALKTYVWGDK